MRIAIGTSVLFSASLLMGWLGINLWVSLIPIYVFIICVAALYAHYYLEKKREKEMIQKKMFENRNKFFESYGIEPTKHGKINLKDRYVLSKKIDEAFDEKAFIDEMMREKTNNVLKKV